MKNRSIPFTPPHANPESFFMHYIENIMQFTYQHPEFMKDLYYAAGISSFMLMTSPWTLSALGITPSISTAAATGLGTAGLITAFAHSYVQQRVFGLPVPNNKHHYEQGSYQYNSASAQLTFTDNDFPILQIEANDPYDSGYVEGYMLANAIKINLEKTNFLYPAMRLLMGAPNNDIDLQKNLDKILQTIPRQYQEEMRGKVRGYNNWLAEHHPHADKLSFEYYLLLQLLPDLHNNYNPFPQKGFLHHLKALLPSVAYKPKMGCTTIALRLGEYTFLTRVLDWPAHAIAGQSFIQIDRKIGDTARIIDIGLPLLSGAATVLNEKGLLIEINVSPGDQVTEPTGMPAFFFNRYCAENAATVKDIEQLLQDQQPLSAYHLTATDGCDTQSFHFYQDQDEPRKHLIECLEKDKTAPQLLAIANHGVQHENGQSKVINCDDSNQRISNIHQLFNHHHKLGKFSSYLDKQKKEDLNKQDLIELKEFLLQVARLPLVNNCESVLCAIYVYHQRDLIDASVAVDNMFAQNKALNEFRQLRF